MHSKEYRTGKMWYSTPLINLVGVIYMPGYKFDADFSLTVQSAISFSDEQFSFDDFENYLGKIKQVLRKHLEFLALGDILVIEKWLKNAQKYSVVFEKESDSRKKFSEASPEEKPKFMTPFIEANKEKRALELSLNNVEICRIFGSANQKLIIALAAIQAESESERRLDDTDRHIALTTERSAFGGLDSGHGATKTVIDDFLGNSASRSLFALEPTFFKNIDKATVEKNRADCELIKGTMRAFARINNALNTLFHDDLDANILSEESYASSVTNNHVSL